MGAGRQLLADGATKNLCRAAGGNLLPVRGARLRHDLPQRGVVVHRLGRFVRAGFGRVRGGLRARQFSPNHLDDGVDVAVAVPGSGFYQSSGEQIRTSDDGR